MAIFTDCLIERKVTVVSTTTKLLTPSGSRRDLEQLGTAESPMKWVRFSRRAADLNESSKCR